MLKSVQVIKNKKMGAVFIYNLGFFFVLLKQRHENINMRASHVCCTVAVTSPYGTDITRAPLPFNVDFLVSVPNVSSVPPHLPC